MIEKAHKRNYLTVARGSERSNIARERRSTERRPGPEESVPVLGVGYPGFVGFAGYSGAGGGRSHLP